MKFPYTPFLIFARVVGVIALSMIGITIQIYTHSYLLSYGVTVGLGLAYGYLLEKLTR